MKQSDLDDALAAYLEYGDIEPWRKILEAVLEKDVHVQKTDTSMTFRVSSRFKSYEFAQRLADLRVESGMTYQALAIGAQIGMTPIIRLFQGRSLPQWPIVAMLVTAMGGNPDDYAEGYWAARSERKYRGRTLNPTHGAEGTS
jgi:hypothetical protein